MLYVRRRTNDFRLPCSSSVYCSAPETPEETNWHCTRQQTVRWLYFKIKLEKSCSFPCSWSQLLYMLQRNFAKVDRCSECFGKCKEKKQKIAHQCNRRLHNRVNSMNSLLSQLRSKQLLSEFGASASSLVARCIRQKSCKPANFCIHLSWKILHCLCISILQKLMTLSAVNSVTVFLTQKLCHTCTVVQMAILGSKLMFLKPWRPWPVTDREVHFHALWCWMRCY